MRAATTRDRCSKIMEAVIPYPLPSASPWGPPDADPGVDEVPQTAAADHGGQYRPADGVDGGHAQPADDGGQGQGKLHPDQALYGAHAAATGSLDVLLVHGYQAGIGVFQHRESGVDAQGNQYRCGARPPGQHQQTDEHDARDGVEDGQDGQDYSGELGPPGQQDAQHKAQGKADGDGHQGEQKMLADGHRKFIPSQCVSPPKLFRHSGGHAGLGDDAVHLFLLVQDDEVGGAAGDQQVEAVLGAVPCVDGGGVAADQGLDGLDHMAGEADVRNGHGALIAVLVVHHDQGVHVAPLHLADALVDAPAGGNGGHAGAHEVGGGELLVYYGVDETHSGKAGVFGEAA